MMPYERLDAWRACHALTIAVYAATRTFPLQERYGLVAQTRSAAYSLSANIAEGAAKHGRQEFRRYLDIALGSLSELTYGLRLAKDLGLLDDAAHADLDRLRDTAGKLTWPLYQAMGRR
jgi:four helix bundle protein